MSKKKFAAKTILAVACAGCISACLPALALAEESEGGSGLTLIIPKLQEFVPMAIAFVILWIIFAKFVYPTVMGMINKRADKIESDLKTAEDNRISSVKLVRQRENELAEARQDASQILANAKQTAETNKQKIEDEAKAQAANIVAKGRATVESERAGAAQELQQSVADLTVEVAGKLIGQDLSDDEHRKIIERYVAEAGSLNAN